MDKPQARPRDNHSSALLCRWPPSSGQGQALVAQARAWVSGAFFGAVFISRRIPHPNSPEGKGVMLLFLSSATLCPPSVLLPLNALMIPGPAGVAVPTAFPGIRIPFSPPRVPRAPTTSPYTTTGQEPHDPPSACAPHQQDPAQRPVAQPTQHAPPPPPPSSTAPTRPPPRQSRAPTHHTGTGTPTNLHRPHPLPTHRIALSDSPDP